MEADIRVAAKFVPVRTKEVTQSPCPLRVPRRVKVSDMLVMMRRRIESQYDTRNEATSAMVDRLIVRSFVRSFP